MSEFNLKVINSQLLKIEELEAIIEKLKAQLLEKNNDTTST